MSPFVGKYKKCTFRESKLDVLSHVHAFRLSPWMKNSTIRFENAEKWEHQTRECFQHQTRQILSSNTICYEQYYVCILRYLSMYN